MAGSRQGEVWNQSSDINCNITIIRDGCKMQHTTGGGGQSQVWYRVENDCDVARREYDNRDHLH